MLDEDLANHGLCHLHDLLFIHERCFNIDLSEFRLTVGTQVLVAETLGDLIIAIHACNHQNLLEQLRRLRQREEMTRVSAAGHQVVTGAFRSCLGQQRCFDIQKAVFVQEIADGVGHLGTEAQTLGHFRAAQIDITVAQTHVLAHIGVFIQQEGRCLGGVENVQLLAQYLDAARAHVSIGRTGRTQTHNTGHLQHELAANGFCQRKALFGIRVEHHLGDTLHITQVDENHAPVVPAAVGPSTQDNFLPFVLFVQFSAIVTAHSSVLFSFISVL